MAMNNIGNGLGTPVAIPEVPLSIESLREGLVEQVLEPISIEHVHRLAYKGHTAFKGAAGSIILVNRERGLDKLSGVLGGYYIHRID